MAGSMACLTPARALDGRVAADWQVCSSRHTCTVGTAATVAAAATAVSTHCVPLTGCSASVILGLEVGVSVPVFVGAVIPTPA